VPVNFPPGISAPTRQLTAADMRVGLRIGAWILRGRVRDNPKHPGPIRKRWRCECICGQKKTIPQSYFTRVAPPLSCGCLNKSLQSMNKLTYNSWVMMHYRCEKPNHVAFEHYGGRGIKVCERWSGPDGFKNFLEDMGPRPSRKLTLDRIDNDGGYHPGNCRWATGKQQRANQRPRTYKAHTQPVASEEPSDA